MRFTLVDRIIELVPGEKIVAIKNVSLSEEYLGDHFPKFPVLPGVFMLEAMTQASAWLVRASEDFQHSIHVLKESRNVKYANFLSPGETLRVEASLTHMDEQEAKLKVVGKSGDTTVVSGRLVLERYNLAETDPATRPADAAATDAIVIDKMRELFALLYRESAGLSNLETTQQVPAATGR